MALFSPLDLLGHDAWKKRRTYSPNGGEFHGDLPDGTK